MVDGRNGLLALAVYLTAAALMVLAALWGVRNYFTAAHIAAIQPIDFDQPPELAAARTDLAAKTDGHRARANMEKLRIRLLETMLEDKTRRLRDLSTQLDRKSGELDELRTRYDEAVAMAMESLSRDVGGAAVSSGTSEQADADKESDPTLLEAELSVAREVHESLVSDVTSLQEELSRAERELERLQEAQDRETIERLREAMTLENAAASVLLRVGREAVPALRDALNHPSPVVRRWAATVLGGLGSDAEDAIAALTEALSDVDPSVRSAVQTALESIER